MTNQKGVAHLCLAVILVVFFPGNTCEAKSNILFILTEDQGAQLSFVGTPGLSTPNMDRIATAGVYFNQAFVNYPVCSPSKANIYTGTYCSTNGLRGVTTNWHGPAHGASALSSAAISASLVIRFADSLSLFVGMGSDSC